MEIPKGQPDYLVSARKWRPQTFEAVIGQEHVTRSLANAIRLDKIAQAYIFSGIRGVGKTSLARILAKGINCTRAGEGVPCNRCELCLEITEGRSVDVIEVDGASNTGVDDVRELRENVKYLPLRARYKIYIIDEVHMLSNAAFNALLKTLEEPPPHLIFILATTEVHKIPATVLSRCQHFTFRRMTHPEIVSQLVQITEDRKVRFSEEGLGFIARVSEGSMRDALSLLDQAISFGGETVSSDDLFNLLGRVDISVFHRLVDAIYRKDALTALQLAKEITDKGCDLRQFLNDWLEHLRHLIVSQNVSEIEGWIDLPKEAFEEIRSEAALFSKEALQRLFSLFVRLQREIRNTPQPFLLFEVTLMKAILLADLQPVETVLDRLDRLTKGEETAIAGVTTTRKPPPFESVHRSGAQSSQAAQSETLSTEKPLKKGVVRPQTDLQNGAADWKTLLVAIKKARPNVGSYLDQGVLIAFTGEEIRLAYSDNSAFLIPLIQKEDNKRWLDGFITSQLGKNIGLNLLERSSKENHPIDGPGLSGPDPMPLTKEMPSHENHPLIQEVLKVMGGSIIDTKHVSNDQTMK